MLKKKAQVARHIEEGEKKEELGWIILAEKEFKNIWDNQKDDWVWKKYLSIISKT